MRVAVRLRPRTADDLIADADFADCVELQPEVNDIFNEDNVLVPLFPVDD